MNMIRNKLNSAVYYLISIGFMLVMLFPLIYTFFSSFKTNRDILAGEVTIIPEVFHFENYANAWRLANFSTYTWNSIYMTFFIVVGTLIISSMAGYAFARCEFPGKKVIFGILTSTMFVSIGSAGLWKQLEIAKVLHINNSLWGIILINLLAAHITNIFLIRNYMSSIPKQIDEAATIDGASFGYIYVKIILPLLKPILATVAIMTFRGAWNAYLLPMIFTASNPSKAPLAVGLMILKNSGDAAASWDILLAGTMISAFPMIVIYIFLGKWFVRGVTSGAVKG